MTTAEVYKTWIDRFISSRSGFLHWRDDSSEEWGHVGVIWHRINENQIQAIEVHFNGTADAYEVSSCIHPPEPLVFTHIR